MWIFWVFKGIFMIHKSFFLCEVRMGLCLSLRFVTQTFKGCELYCSFEVTACSQPVCMTGHLTVTVTIKPPLLSTHLPHTVYNVCKFLQQK